MYFLGYGVSFIFWNLGNGFMKIVDVMKLYFDIICEKVMIIINDVSVL